MVTKLNLTAALARARHEAAFAFNAWVETKEPKFKAAHDEALVEINSLKAKIKHLFGAE